MLDRSVLTNTAPLKFDPLQVHSIHLGVLESSTVERDITEPRPIQTGVAERRAIHVRLRKRGIDHRDAIERDAT